MIREDVLPSMTKPLTRQILDKLTCQVPGCTHDRHEGLVLHARCHVEAPSTARYWPSGIVEVSCLVCDRLVVEVTLDAKEREVANKRLECTDPGCKEPPENHSLVFRSPCHRDAGVFVSYQNGHLHMLCGSCQTLVESHHVAEESP